jgi:hypothetical protein
MTRSQDHVHLARLPPVGGKTGIFQGASRHAQAQLIAAIRVVDLAPFQGGSEQFIRDAPATFTGNGLSSGIFGRRQIPERPSSRLRQNSSTSKPSAQATLIPVTTTRRGWTGARGSELAKA